MRGMENDSYEYKIPNFDVDLQEFYFDVISEEVDVCKRWHAVGIRRALTEVVDAYRKMTVKKYKSFIRFDTPAKRCAYLLKHGPCFTNAVAKYLFKLVKNNPDILMTALNEGELAICCLGGGPASDAVAVARIIRYLYQPYWNRTGKTLKLTVYVVDISEDWCVTAKNLLQYLKNTPKFVGVNEMELTYEFYTADLTEKLDDKVKAVIRSADVITMIYFLSAVNGSAVKDKSQQMLEENIMLNMKTGAILFYLDSAADQHYQVLNKAARKRKTVKEIYGPLSEEFHTISIESVEKFLQLYSPYFYRFICMTNNFLAVSAWCKFLRNDFKYQIKTIIKGPDPSSWKKPGEDESDSLTRKMKTYRGTVNRLLNKATLKFSDIRR